MNRREITRLDRQLTAYVDELLDGMGRKERVRATGWYITGLLLDGERKSIEPMAARLVDDAGEIQAMRQRLREAVTVSAWSDAETWKRLALKIDRELPDVEALVIDDTGFAKKGAHSVGVSRQYSGTGEEAPTKFHLANVDANAPLKRLVTSQSLAGASSATARNSNRRSGSATSKDEAGRALTTTQRSARSPTDSSRSAERSSPPEASSMDPA